MTTSRAFRFVGQNIKGTPAMSAAKVAHDVRVVNQHADVAVLQEFKWAWYWRALIRVLGKSVSSYPAEGHGLANPIHGAQAVLWRPALFKPLEHRVALLHAGRPGWTDDRMLRAVHLADQATKLSCWVGGTHFVVNGDRANDPVVGHEMMAEDLAAFDTFLGGLVRTGSPVLWEMDANIAVASQAWPKFRAIVEKHGGKFHGHLGVEYLFTIGGKTTDVVVTEAWTIPTSQLYTDHEGRGVTFHLHD